MVATVLTLQHDHHDGFLKKGISQMIYHAGYLNVKVICKDGTLYHNRMTIGLIFPGIKDESVAIIPDMTVQEITDEINKLFGASDDRIDCKDSSGDETEERVVIINGDEKLSVSEVNDELFNSEDDFVMFENAAKESKETDQNNENNGCVKKRQKSQKKRPKSKRKQRKTEAFTDTSDKSLHEEEEFIENISSVSENAMKTFNNNNCNINRKMDTGPMKNEASSSKFPAAYLKNKAGPLMSDAATLRSKAGPLMNEAATLRSKAGPLMSEAATLRSKVGTLISEAVPLKRTRHVGRCHKCPNCKIENCGDCHACLNMKQFGGTGSLKKACITRPPCLEKTKKNDTSANVDEDKSDTSAMADRKMFNSDEADKKNDTSAMADKNNDTFVKGGGKNNDTSSKEKIKKSDMSLRERRKKSDASAKAVVVKRVGDDTIPLVEEVQGGVFTQELLSEEEI